MEPGTRIGHYEIIRPLGAGGMGEVYVASDLKLERQVAIKVLPEEFTSDPDRRARFLREAKAVAALNHPNIVVVHAVEEEESRIFLTMELVEGVPLSERINGEPMPLGTLFDIAIPLADAISAAHQNGIAHRDLKPDNIMITAEGRVKVLDFGLAKLLEAGPESELAAAATAMLTEEGRILGTVAYMSPEQAQGREVDARTDIFSLGIILYEMATGRRPFDGDSKMSILASVIKDTPQPVVEVNRGMPRHLGRIVKHCLEKEPDRRYQSVLDVRNELTSLREEVRSGEVDLPGGAPVSSETGAGFAAAGTITGSQSAGLTSAELSATGASGPVVEGASRPTGAPTQRLRMLGAAAVIVVLAGAGLWWSVGRTTPDSAVSVQSAAIDQRPSIAVLPFENTSGAEELEWVRDGMAEMLVTDLSQVAGLRVLGRERIREVLGDRADDDEAQRSVETFRALAAAAGTTTVIVGSYLQAGDQLRVSARIIDANTGDVIAGESVDGTGQQSLFASTDALSRWIRTTLEASDGGAGAAIDRDLTEVSTSSVEAFRAYTEGVELQHRSREVEAVRRLEEAVELDPEFALAYVKLSIIYGNLRQYEERDYYAERALEHADRLSERERYYFEGAYYSRSGETADRSIAAYSKAIELYPDDTASRNNLAMQLSSIHRHAEASTQLEEALRRGSTFGGARTNLIYNYLREGRLDDAETFARNYLRAEPDAATAKGGWLEVLMASGRLEEARRFMAEEGDSLGQISELRLRLRLATLLEDWDEISRIADSIGDDVPGGRQLASGFVSSALLYQGRSREALDLVEAEAEAQERGAGPEVYAAELMLLRGDAQAASDRALAARPEAPSVGVELYAIEVAARARAEMGRQAAVDVLKADHEAITHRIGTPHFQLRHYLLLGQLAVAGGDGEGALEQLTRARDLLEAPMGYWAPGPHAQVGYAIGQAHLLRGDADAAEAAFETVTTLRQPRLSAPVPFVRSFYFLGNLRARRGDTAGAREAYERFLGYWGEGDIDRERVREAAAFVNG